jgi:diphosphomevalonate decarboxylase
MSPQIEDDSQALVATARAHANIALAKYWGKADTALNLAAVPSLSLTLAQLSTTTTVRFEPALREDTLILNGLPATPHALARARAMLDQVRRQSGVPFCAHIESTNDFPTASGLASSASGFAALATASVAAAQLNYSPAAISSLARASSVSAARSVFGGFVRLDAGAQSAEPIDAQRAAEQLVMLIAVTDPGPKDTGSTQGMLHTQATSPYFDAWTSSARLVYDEALNALQSADFERLGEAMEHSTLLMHASMLAARPALIYIKAATVDVIECVRALRRGGTLAHFTMDAGPHVKVLTTTANQGVVQDRLRAVPGVQEVIVARAGPAARVLERA